MITIFPEPYEDELLYSFFARYYMKSGYGTFIDVAEELYQRATTRPDKEFYNPLTEDARIRLTAIKPMEDMIVQHTMYPNYARFVDREARRNSLEALDRMDTHYRNSLPMRMTGRGKERFMRYCPLCADKDREIYGETYWHRLHQLMGVNLCPMHGCTLAHSKISMSCKASPSLVNAEMAVLSKSDVIINENKVDIQLARYIAEIFTAPMDFNQDVPIGHYLHYRMDGTKYRSIRGEQRNIQLLHDDFMDYYKQSENEGLTELWQIQKVLTGYRKNSYEVAQLAMFLNISAEDLLHPVLPEKTQEQLFDEKVKQMREAGMSYPAIAEQLGASVNIVKPIGALSYKKHHISSMLSEKSGVKPNDWNCIDKDLLPQVRQVAKKLYGTRTERPHRVSVTTVCRIMELPEGYLKHLTLCLEAVKKYAESQQEYWAREVVWAACQVQRNGEILIWRRIRDLTNLRRDNFEACLPFIVCFADKKMAEEIMKLR